MSLLDLINPLKFLLDPLTKITEDIIEAKAASANAANDKDRIASDERIAVLTAKQQILLAEQGSWMTRWVRPAFALPFVIYLFKCVAWDKVWPGGVTDPLGTDLTQVMMLVIAGYFVDTVVQRITGR